MEKQTINAYWKRVSEELKELGVTLKFMCEITKIDYKSITDWRTKHRIPNPDALVKISEFLGVTTDYLLTGKDADPNQYLMPYLERMQRENPAKMEIIKELLGVPSEKKEDKSSSMVG